MKVGLSVRMTLQRSTKSRLYKGAKGTYLDLTTFVDTEQQDQYENNGFISHQPPRKSARHRCKRLYWAT